VSVAFQTHFIIRGTENVTHYRRPRSLVQPTCSHHTITEKGCMSRSESVQSDHNCIRPHSTVSNGTLTNTRPNFTTPEDRYESVGVSICTPVSWASLFSLKRERDWPTVINSSPDPSPVKPKSPNAKARCTPVIIFWDVTLDWCRKLNVVRNVVTLPRVDLRLRNKMELRTDIFRHADLSSTHR
jgi:hypothetical protein